MKTNQDIKTIRLALGLTLQELACKSGISVAEISMLETGRRKGRPDTLRKIEKALELPEGILLEDSHDKI